MGTVYYVTNQSKDVTIYKLANSSSEKVGTLKAKKWLPSSGLTKQVAHKGSGGSFGSSGGIVGGGGGKEDKPKTSLYYMVSDGYILANDVYADNMGDTNAGDGSKRYDKYSDYLDFLDPVIDNWRKCKAGTRVEFQESVLSCTTNNIFVFEKASTKSSKVGYCDSGCKITVINVVCYDEYNNVIGQCNSTTTNGDGTWYKIFAVNGSHQGAVKGKWINLTVYEKLLENGGVKNIPSIKSNSKNSKKKSTVVEEKTIQSYSTYMTQDEYYNNLKDGLKVQDLRGIFGLPYQFLPLTDPRIDMPDDGGVGEIDQFGTVYTEKIINPMPLLLVTPGSPEFMTSYNDKQRKTMLSKYLGFGVDSTTLKALVNEKSGKFYSLRYNYTEYFYYVNAMCRSAAFFLGINDTVIDGKPLSDFNWLYDNTDSGTDIFGHKGLHKFLGTYAGALPFYVDAETSITDSFSNSTSMPSIADTVNGVADKAREMNFLLGSVTSNIGIDADNFLATDGASKNLQDIEDQLESMLHGNHNILSNLTRSASTIISGGKMLFPEIWSSSDFSRSYSVTLKFPSPSGDKLSKYLNCLVPVFHCLGLTLPRQSASQAYYSPFLIRAYYKGIFNVDMGIITGLSFRKGADGEWADDGIPTVVEVSMDIKDLYSGLFMSKQKAISDLSIFSNIAELDYIANMCGININEPDVRRTVEMYLSMGIVTNIKDRVQLGIWGGITQWANRKVQNIFGKF